MRGWQYVALWLASVALAWAADSCFLTADLSNVVPGQPFLLAWGDRVGSWWDILLNTDVRTRASLVGSIARNVTENAVVWLPPADIADAEPNKLYAVQLWDLGRGTSCISQTFRFKTNDKPPQPLPAGPLVTTSASLSFGPVKVTATVASFSTSVEPSYTSAIPTTTSAPDPEPEKPKTNVIAIAIGVVFGTLVTALVVLSVCLWRAKRKRAQNRGTILASDDGKGGSYDRDLALSPAPPSAHPVELESSAGGFQAAEMQVEEPRHEMPTGDGRLVAEMPGEPMAPVELPAEVPESLPVPARRQSQVSALTSDSRRPSLDQYTVSPATLTMRRTSLIKS